MSGCAVHAHVAELIDEGVAVYSGRLKHRISGAPVVDGNDELVGIVREFQLLGVIYDVCAS